MTPRTVLLNNKGMSLIEVLIAMLLFLIISLALLQASIISVDQNTLDSMREEAMRVAETRMNDARTLPFSSARDDLTDATDGDALGSGCPAGFFTSGVKVNRNIRNAVNVVFCTNQTVTTIGDDARQIIITVGWTWKNGRYLHEIRSIVRKL